MKQNTALFGNVYSENMTHEISLPPWQSGGTERESGSILLRNQI